MDTMTTNGNGSTILGDSGVVVVPQGSPEAGAVVWWHLSGRTDAAALRLAWEAQGLDAMLLPDLPSPQTALRRAMYALKGPRTLVRSLDKATSKWAVVQERLADASATPGGGGAEPLDYNVECVVHRSADDKLTFEPAGVFDDAHPLVQQVRGAFYDALGVYDHADIGGWLSRLVRKIDAVPLRETGGVYFVPREHVGTLNKMRAAIRSTSANNVQTVPAMRNDDAVEAILDAVRREAEEEAKGMEEDLLSGRFGKRGLESRASRCSAAAGKIERYEALLGASLESLRGRLDDLHAGLAAAALAATDDEVQS